MTYSPRSPTPLPGVIPVVPFESFPDYSRMNKGKHNGTRQDTFHTPGRLVGSSDRARSGVKSFVAAVSGSSPARAGTPSGMAGLGTRELLDVCELSFAKNLRDLHAGLLADLRDCVHTALDPLRDELAATVADSRSVAAIEKIQKSFESLQIPQFDAEPLCREFRESLGRSDEACRRGQEEIMEELRALREDCRLARKREEEAFASFGVQVAQVDDGMRSTQFRMGKIVEMQEVLQNRSESISTNVGEIQARSAKQTEEFSGNLEIQLTEFVQSRPVNVDFGSVIHHIDTSSTTVSNALTFLLGEIGKIQQALNVDFVSVLDLRLHEMGKGLTESVNLANNRPGRKSNITDKPGAVHGGRKVRRLRDVGGQTDNGEAMDVWCQTDELLPEKKKAKKKKVNNPRSTKTKSPAGGMFADAEQMKNQARLNLIRPQYNVQDYYYETGMCQYIATHSYFEYATLVAIIFNCIWMAVDVDLNDADVLYNAHPVFQVVENLFCFYFTFEIVTRFLAFEGKKYALRDFWFSFDFVLVLLMVLETWVVTFVLIVSPTAMGSGGFENAAVLRVAKIVKMLRVSRMARLLRSVPELVILMKGVKAASRSVVVFLCMWGLIVFIYALVFRQIAAPDSEYFSSMPEAMNTLWLNCIFADYAPLVNGATSEQWVFWPLMMSFISLAVLILMNMLVGVIIEIVNAVALTEREGMTALYCANEFRRMFEEQGMEPTHCMTHMEFANFVSSPDVAQLIESIGVDVVLLMDMAPNVFEDLHKANEVGMSFEKLVDLVLQMRGTNPAKVRDVKEHLRSVKTLMQDHQKMMEQTVSKLQAEVAALTDRVRDAKESPDQGGEHDTSDDESMGNGVSGSARQRSEAET